MDKVSRGERTREDIIRSGARLFSLHGYFATSLQDILEAVSISKGAFYHHFKSKQDLVIAALERLQADYEREVFGPVRAVGKPGERLEKLLSRLVELNASGQWDNCLLLARLAQEMTREYGEPAEKTAEVISRLVGFWEELIDDAQAADAVRSDLDTRALAELMVAMFFGAIGSQALAGEILHLDKIVEHIQLMIAK